MSEEAKWYVVHTYSGYENKVKEDLEKTVENRNLQDMILEVKYPTEEVVEIKDAKRKVVQRKVYPGYVMIKMIMNDKTWYVVRNTRGVTGFVGPGSKPIPLTDEEVTAPSSWTSPWAKACASFPARWKTSLAPWKRSIQSARR